MKDILQTLFLKYPFSVEGIERWAVGQKIVAIMHSNGNVGICSTLGKEINGSIGEVLKKPDLSKYEHRIIVNAWVNANANYKYSVNGNSDIFNAIDFSEFKSLVMVGYFGSLAQKMSDKGIRVKIFDIEEEDKPVEPMNKQLESIAAADGIILTATTLANETYFGLLNAAPTNCKVYFLGPSSPITPQIFDLPNIQGVFGCRFKPFDSEVLDIIAEGGGTRAILGKMDKVFLLK